MLCYEYPPIGGGGAKVVHGLTNALSKMNCEIDLVTMGYKGLPYFEKVDNVNIYRVKCLRFNKNICTYPEMLTYIISAFPLVLRLGRINKYIINHTHFIFPDGALAYLLHKFNGLNYVITAHGSDVPGYNPNRFKTLHKLLKPFWNGIVKASKKIVFPSNNLNELFKTVNNKVEGITIPNGINLTKFSHLKQKEKQVLVVSRMFERKGVQYILKAFSGLETCYTLNIVGDGPFLETLKNLSNELNVQANFLGFMDNGSEELKNLYEDSEIFIFTSESENFPIVLLEAMLAGMAIITSQNTGCAEVVGDSGILVDPKDSNLIREELIKLMANKQLLKNLQLAARNRVEELFGWDGIARQYMKLYENCAENKYV
jgi:L-malate glycosyltransferase